MIVLATAALASGPELAGRWVAVVGTAADPQALAAVDARVAARDPVAAWSSDYAGLRPCWHLTVVGAFVEASAATDLVRALKSEGIDAYARFTGAWIGDRPRTDRNACPTAGGSEIRFLDPRGAVRLGPYEAPGETWPDGAERRPLSADAVDGLRRGDRLRVGDRICTVVGFEAVRACMDQSTAVAVLAPAGCGLGAPVAGPASLPAPDELAEVPVPAAAVAALGTEVLAVDAPDEARITRRAWSGPLGLVVTEAVDVWRKRDDDDCGGMDHERTSRTVWFPGGDPSVVPRNLEVPTDADVTGILDLDRDGRPEVRTEDPDRPTTIWSYDGSVRAEVSAPFCTCGC